MASLALGICSLPSVFIHSFRYHVLNILVVQSIDMKSKHTLVQSYSTTNLLLSKLFKLTEHPCLYMESENEKSFSCYSGSNKNNIFKYKYIIYKYIKITFTEYLLCANLC